jgi:hypothetical protein
MAVVFVWRRNRGFCETEVFLLFWSFGNKARIAWSLWECSDLRDTIYRRVLTGNPLHVSFPGRRCEGYIAIFTKVYQ